MANDNLTYGFSKQDATDLLGSLGNSDVEYSEMKPRGSIVCGIFMTPAAGIVARAGTTAGKALCVQYRISSVGVLSAISGSSVSVKNIFGSSIGGSVYITAKKVNGVWVADAEDCG